MAKNPEEKVFDVVIRFGTCVVTVVKDVLEGERVHVCQQNKGVTIVI